MAVATHTAEAGAFTTAGAADQNRTETLALTMRVLRLGAAAAFCCRGILPPHPLKCPPSGIAKRVIQRGPTPEFGAPAPNVGRVLTIEVHPRGRASQLNRSSWSARQSAEESNPIPRIWNPIGHHDLHPLGAP